MRIIAGLLLLNLVATGLLGQETANKLVLPTSPAFSILDYEPSSVLRPSSYKDLAADVLNSIDKNGKLLMNLGLEVTPYWLSSRPGLSRKDFLDPTTKQLFLQTFTLSAATVKDSVSGNNKLGVGLRFRLLNGHQTKASAEGEQVFQRQLGIINHINGVRIAADSTTSISDAITAIKNNLTKDGYHQQVVETFLHKVDSMQQAEQVLAVKAFLKKVIGVYESDNKEINKSIEKLQYDREGWILEFAGAGGFKVNKGNQSSEKIGGWANLSNSVGGDDIFTLTTRYMYENGDTLKNNLDVGLGYVKEDRHFNISLEAMARWYNSTLAKIPGSSAPKEEESKFTYRFAVQGSYAISPTVSISLSFGKDFDSPFISRSGFFSILGATYTLFEKLNIPEK